MLEVRDQFVDAFHVVRITGDTSIRGILGKEGRWVRVGIVESGRNGLAGKVPDDGSRADPLLNIALYPDGDKLAITDGKRLCGRHFVLFGEDLRVEDDQIRCIRR